MALIITSTFPELIYEKIVLRESPFSYIFKKDTAKAEPKRPKTIATVVDVGKPNVLKVSSKIILPNMTATKITMSSENSNIPGLKIDFRATSIIPPLIITPTMTPTPAIIMIVLNDAALAPIAELRKLIASLATPTTRPITAVIPST